LNSTEGSTSKETPKAYRKYGKKNRNKKFSSEKRQNSSLFATGKLMEN
jgi:hypothetical protein